MFVALVDISVGASDINNGFEAATGKYGDLVIIAVNRDSPDADIAKKLLLVIIQSSSAISRMTDSTIVYIYAIGQFILHRFFVTMTTRFGLVVVMSGANEVILTAREPF